jgi:hypothetical protein
VVDSISQFFKEKLGIGRDKTDKPDKVLCIKNVALNQSFTLKFYDDLGKNLGREVVGRDCEIHQ